MAQYTITAKRGQHYQEFTSGAGAPVNAAASMSLTFDASGGLTKGDLQIFVEEVEKFINARTFPPA